MRVWVRVCIECARNSRALFKVIDDLMKRTNAPKLPWPVSGIAQIADDFLEHFTREVFYSRSQLASRRVLTVTADCLQCEASCSLSAFSGITIDFVISLVTKCPTKTSGLGPLPTTLVKANIDILAPILVKIINISLESGTVPATFKYAVIAPLLKKPNLDPDLMNNYRPISNLSFASKMLERHVAAQLRQHLENNDLLDIFQSAYRQHHSTETALVRIQNDHLISVDRKKVVLTLLLDMSAAFDQVDHSMLIDQMRSIGIEGTALKWLESYISNRTHTVRIGSHNSHRTLIESGIPQGCVLGPVVFSIYTMPLDAIFRKYQLQYHIYADDAQLYVDLSEVRDGETADAVCRVERCIEEARLWMSDHNLLLNENKTEAIIISAPNRKHLQDVTCVSVCGCNIVPSSTIRNLGIV